MFVDGEPVGHAGNIVADLAGMRCRRPSLPLTGPFRWQGFRLVHEQAEQLGKNTARLASGPVDPIVAVHALVQEGPQTGQVLGHAEGEADQRPVQVSHGIGGGDAGFRGPLPGLRQHVVHHGPDHPSDGLHLKEKNPKIQVWAIDSYGSLLKKYFETGEEDQKEVYPYISEGFGEDFVPANYDMSLIDLFEKVTDKDGAVMARRIAKEEGLFCGYSAGSCLQGLMQLKDQLKKEDVVVCIFHDHGSRYVAKIYNDEWMMERGFLDVKTFKDIVSGRTSKRLITVNPTDTVSYAVELMKKYDIEQIPVISNGELIGAVSETGLFMKVFSNPEIKNESVASVLEAPYPIVAFDTAVERLGSLITKENGAVLAKDDKGDFHIVTKYDVIQSLAK